jgi:hypothetical protein
MNSPGRFGSGMRMESPGFQLSGISKKEGGGGFSRPPSTIAGPLGEVRDLTSRLLKTSYSDVRSLGIV